MRRQFIALLHSQRLRDGDVTFLLQGDGLARAKRAAELVQQGLAPIAAIVGSAYDRKYGSFPSREVRDELIRVGLASNQILFEETAPHTRAEADRAMALAADHGWKTILVITSPHHQYRAFLTFLAAMRERALDLVLVNAVAPLSMDDENPWGRRKDLLKQEFEKIGQYQKTGDVASYADGVAYLAKML